ncbi:MAG: hypothetical protein PHI98_13285 [Eubacteriales bacterium]|nr:hypothetical protein [Eubacteriales bacterium]
MGTFFIFENDKKHEVSQEVYQAYKRPAWVEKKRAKVRKDKELSIDAFKEAGYEQDIQDAFVQVLGKLMADKGEVIAFCQKKLQGLLDASKLEQEITQQRVTVGCIKEKLYNMVQENARNALDQDVFEQEYEQKEKELEKQQGRLEQMLDAKRDRESRVLQLQGFIERFHGELDGLSWFHEDVFLGMVDVVKVIEGGEMVFVLKNGMEVNE